MGMDEFKEFVKNKPFLKEKVKRKEVTWQELYERYDLYGEDDDAFKEDKHKKEEKNDEGISKVLDMLGDVDINKISEGLNGMRKILNIITEVTSLDTDLGFNKKRSRPYQRKDD